MPSKRRWLDLRQVSVNTEAYPTPFAKAAALLESLAVNHPFVDGNKRIALVLALYLLEEMGYQLTPETDNDSRHQMVVAVASGELRHEGITEWLRQHTAPV